MNSNYTKNEDIYYFNRYISGCMFNITFAGISYPDPDYVKCRDLSDDLYVFEYVLNGRGTISSEGMTDEITEGDLYIINTKYPQIYRSDKDEPLEKIWVNAHGRLLDSLAGLYLGERPYVIRRNSREIYPQFTAIREYLTDSALTTDEAFEYIALILHRLMIYINKPNDSDIPADIRHSAADSVRAFIDRNLSCELKLSEIAKRYYISENHLIRLFKAAYGTTPKQYQLSKRVEQAELMMDNTKITLGEAAAILGFSSVQHFSAVYRKHRGYAPGNYRKQKINQHTGE